MMRALALLNDTLGSLFGTRTHLRRERNNKIAQKNPPSSPSECTIILNQRRLLLLIIIVPLLPTTPPHCRQNNMYKCKTRWLLANQRRV